MNRGISLRGGTSVTVFHETDMQELESFLMENFNDFETREISDLRTGRQMAFVVEVTEDPDEAVPLIEEYLGFELEGDDYSVEFTGPAIGEGFYIQLLLALLYAFIFMGAVVFFIFGENIKMKILVISLALLNPLLFFTFGFITTNVAIYLGLITLIANTGISVFFSIPSAAVVLSAISDIIMTLTVVNLMGMSMTSVGIVSLLMLVGYSVDSDILMSSKILKRKEGTLNSRIFSAFKTGITMTATSLAAVLVALVIVFSLSATLAQLFTILAIGLGFDLMNTWIANLGIVKWHIEKKKNG